MTASKEIKRMVKSWEKTIKRCTRLYDDLKEDELRINTFKEELFELKGEISEREFKETMKQIEQLEKNNKANQKRNKTLKSSAEVSLERIKKLL